MYLEKNPINEKHTNKNKDEPKAHTECKMTEEMIEETVMAENQVLTNFLGYGFQQSEGRGVRVVRVR